MTMAASRPIFDEFVFRWNRRRHDRSAFDMLLGIEPKAAPMSYRALVLLRHDDPR
jgi:hypothetical protein